MILKRCFFADFLGSLLISKYNALNINNRHGFLKFPFYTKLYLFFEFNDISKFCSHFVKPYSLEVQISSFLICLHFLVIWFDSCESWSSQKNQIIVDLALLFYGHFSWKLNFWFKPSVLLFLNNIFFFFLKFFEQRCFYFGQNGFIAHLTLVIGDLRLFYLEIIFLF